MIKTKDEILYKFAALFDDFPVPAPEPPDPSELYVGDTKEVDEESARPTIPLPIPIPIPEENKSQEDKILRGIREIAENNTYRFLTDTQTDFEGYKGFVRNPRLAPIVREVMDKIIEENPRMYFEWQLYHPKRHDGALGQWLYPAMVSFIEKDPVGAILSKTFEVPKTERFYNEMWLKAWEKRKGEYEGRKYLSHREKNKDEFAKQMMRLSEKIADIDPEFYQLYVEKTPFKTWIGIQTREQRQEDMKEFFTK